MLDSEALASIPLVAANTAPPAPDYPWPMPYSSAMFLSFDVDAESAWTSKDALHAQRLITMSYGGFEARVRPPQLLGFLEPLDLKATVFVTRLVVLWVPGGGEWNVRCWPQVGPSGVP